MLNNTPLRAVCTACITFMFVSLDSNATAFKDQLVNLDPARWQVADGWQNGYPFYSRWESDAISFGSKGMTIELAPDGKLNEAGQRTYFSGELRSHDYYSYGCYEVEMKPIKAPGVVTSFFLFAGPYDKPVGGSGKHNEIDIEFLGSNTNMVQLNFWTDDDEYANTHETLIFLDFDASQQFHRYGIYWGKDFLEWFVDGKSVLKVRNNRFDPIPNAEHSKLRVMANVWAVDHGVANWAGRFNIDNPNRYSARYRNFSFTPESRCL
ncbi:family 16 glycosylhydrolase [Vibrio panuliri]|uniref:Beta-glucanase n=1 Tax=Vibrio panuliri TaxID=1381081 RepID=A0ABX3F9I6_9VIBR|nr:family 16 glycosylhydrolase [Vibrio panuliri]KAB1457135.1 family 16 glycosylhydrolase [Vibrio panuliri]OLQ87626.1 1,3-beta-glucanase [Vibrio panuliri]